MSNDAEIAISSKALGNVGNAAVKWLAMHKPSRLSKKKHLENPTVNCATPEEKRLAIAVATLIKSGW